MLISASSTGVVASSTSSERLMAVTKTGVLERGEEQRADRGDADGSGQLLDGIEDS